MAGSSCVAIFYCYAAAAESTSSPHKRIAPFQDSHAGKMMHAVLEARNGSDSVRRIAHGDMFFLNDTFEPGLHSRTTNIFRWAADQAEGEKRVQGVVARG